MRAAEREQFFQNLSKAIPEPITELQHANTFELLIAIILSAQTTDAAVNKVTPLSLVVIPLHKNLLRLNQKKY